MSRSRTRRRRHRDFAHRTQPGAPPGILVPLADAQPTVMTLMAYGPDGCDERPIRNVAEAAASLAKYPVTWLNVDGLADITVVQEAGRLFNLHRLALEDVVHQHQRAKCEQYGDVHFIVVRAPIPGQVCETEQVSLFVGPKFVITFQEAGGDQFEPIRNRIRSGFSRGKLSADYLMYALLDAVIDSYFPLLEQSGDRLDALEVDVIGPPSREVMPRIHAIKRDLQHVRRAIWPLRDAVNTLLRDPAPWLTDETRLYLRDCHDHAIQLIDLLENYRELAGALTDVHLSMLSNYTNEVMRVLTVISTIFIPLTFVVGVYGMNFRHMPELEWPLGYLFVMVLNAVVGGGFVYFFWRRGWIFSGASRRLAEHRRSMQEGAGEPPPSKCP